MANFRLNADKAEKTAPVGDDIYMIEDSAAAYGVKYVKHSTIVSDAINPAGLTIDYPGSSLSGYLLCNGETIGDVASGADNESSDYETLFEIIKSKTEYGNTGSEVWANGDTVNLPDLRYEYGFFRLSANQETNLSVGNHIEFDTRDEGNITVSTGSGQDNGVFSLNPYKEYNFDLTTFIGYSSSNGLGRFIMYDETALNSFGIHSYHYPIGDTNNNTPTSSLTAIGIFTQATDVHVRIDANTSMETIFGNYSTGLLITTPGLSKGNTFIKY